MWLLEVIIVDKARRNYCEDDMFQASVSLTDVYIAWR
jgi:hypothetical protein